MTSAAPPLPSAPPGVENPHPEPGPARPRHDVVDGVLWFVLGTAILIGSWRMDRLEEQQINPYTIPGLVPGLLGLAMMLIAAIMAFRGMRLGGLAVSDGAAARKEDYGRLAKVLGLCVVFAVGLVGRGPPFWLAAALFVSTAIVVLRWDEFHAEGRLARGIATAVCIGVGAGVIVTLVFEKFFFVRLP
jgi:hypothetical protein